jgi:hypothetical protein
MKRLATALVWLLGAQCVVAAATAPALLQEARRLDAVEESVWWTEELPAEPWIVSGAEIVWPALFVATMLLWFVWQYRGHTVLVAAGVRRLRFTPTWAVLWWFIPVANMGYPPSVTGELLRGAKAGPERRADEIRASPFVLPWWIALLVGLVAGGVGWQLRVAYRGAMGIEIEPGVIAAGDRTLIVASIALAIAAPLAIAIVLRVERLLGGWSADAISSPTRPDAGPRPGRPDLV